MKPITLAKILLGLFIVKCSTALAAPLTSKERATIQSKKFVKDWATAIDADEDIPLFRYFYCYANLTHISYIRDSFLIRTIESKDKKHELAFIPTRATKEQELSGFYLIHSNGNAYFVGTRYMGDFRIFDSSAQVGNSSKIFPMLLEVPDFDKMHFHLLEESVASGIVFSEDDTGLTPVNSKKRHNIAYFKKRFVGDGPLALGLSQFGMSRLGSNKDANEFVPLVRPEKVDIKNVYSAFLYTLKDGIKGVKKHVSDQLRGQLKRKAIEQEDIDMEIYPLKLALDSERDPGKKAALQKQIDQILKPTRFEIANEALERLNECQDLVKHKALSKELRKDLMTTLYMVRSHIVNDLDLVERMYP